jgi:toxin YoeB
MAQQKKVVWSERAQKEKLKILDFWIQQNKSTSYSEKLNSVIEETLELLKNHPEIGRKTDIGEDIRMKFIGDYEVFYN